VKKISYLVFLVLFVLLQPISRADSAPSMVQPDASAANSESTAPPTAAAETEQKSESEKPKTNAEIRQWYNDVVGEIPTLNEKWISEGISVEERAKQAFEIRHNARLEARAMMQNKEEVAALQARDQEKYGNPDGPTFEYLVEKNREKGMEGDAIYENIIGSSNRTNREYNEKFGVKQETQSP